MTVTSKGLGRRGRGLWNDLNKEYEFDAQELNLVLEACRTADTIEALAAAVEVSGVMAVGSQGQPVTHPAVAEQRMQQASLGRLLGMLNLGALEDGVALQRATSAKAQAAANARWSGQRKARNS